jgi:type VI secretion system protein
MAVTIRFQSTGAIPGDARPVPMLGRSLTIGRSDTNDIVLPDPNKEVSKSHCAIEDQNGNVVVVDLSTNGTFLNYGKVPLGRVPTPLNDGDILSVGPYELLVAISPEATAPDPASLAPAEMDPVSPGLAVRASDLTGPEPDADGDFIDELLGGAAPSGHASIDRPGLADDGLLPPLDEDDLSLPGGARAVETGPTQGAHNAPEQDHLAMPAPAQAKPVIPDDWDDLLEGIGTSGPAAPPPEPIPPEPIEAAPAWSEPSPADPEGVDLSPVDPAPSIPVEEPQDDPPPVDLVAAPPSARPEPVTPAATAPTTAPGDPAARAFLAALDAGDLLADERDLTPAMTRLGGVMRTLIHGIREILMTRASLKSEFRIQSTMIAAGGNNPLKFSISPEQAVEALVEQRTRGYLDPEAAAAEALDDIKAHEVAVMAGVEAALKGLLSRLSPDEVAARIEGSTGSGLTGVLKGRKARYWEIYEKLYAEIADEAENDFHEVFSRTFAKAYQAQLDRLKSR